jgi:hypothetical protein
MSARLDDRPREKQIVPPKSWETFEHLSLLAAAQT